MIWMAIGGCEQNKGSLPGNVAPHTYLAVVGADLDTTDYRKIIHWWGSDPDGEVHGYLIRWNQGWQSPHPDTTWVFQDTTYVFTTATEDTFVVPIGGTFAERRFTVRAVDDQDLVDPVGASQAFPLSDRAPVVSWNPDIPLPETSLPAAAFGFNVTDDDGRATVRSFRIWLDGDSARAKTVADTVVAMFPEDFGERIGQTRTVYVQAYDEADTPSNIISHTWMVEAPQGDYLLIDQIGTGNLARWENTFYPVVMDSTIGSNRHRLDLFKGADFVTKVEIEPLFSLFRGVLWLGDPYRKDNDLKMAHNLQTAEIGIRNYVEKGGRILIMGQSVLGTGGGLSNEFAQEVLGITTFFEQQTNPETRVTDIPLSTDRIVYFQRDGRTDSLKAYHTPDLVDYFQEPSAPGTGRYWVAPGSLRKETANAILPPQDTEKAYVGVTAAYGQGRIGVVTTCYPRLYDVLHNPNWKSTIGEAVALFREVLL